MSNIIHIERIDPAQTYDLEVAHPDHQFYLANGALTSNSHAVSYAIDSFYCAWLLTYFEEHWLAAYLQTASENPEKLARAIGDVRSVGYSIGKLDINTADRGWKGDKANRVIYPSFYSAKRVGEGAVDEILRYRPYRTIDDLLWNPDGTWRHAKFNKSGLDSLIKVGALDSLDLVGPGKEFSSYAHLHFCVIDNWDLVKKSPQRDPDLGRRTLHELAAATYDDVADWTRSEKVEFLRDIKGDVSVDDVVSPEVLQALGNRSIEPLTDDFDKGFAWFIPEEVLVKRSKKGKEYLYIRGFSAGARRLKVFVWGWNPDKHDTVTPYDVVVGEVEKSDFGFGMQAWKLKVVSA